MLAQRARDIPRSTFFFYVPRFENNSPLRCHRRGRASPSVRKSPLLFLFPLIADDPPSRPCRDHHVEMDRRQSESKAGSAESGDANPKSKWSSGSWRSSDLRPHRLLAFPDRLGGGSLRDDKPTTSTMERLQS
ncbi:hypothetical protein HN011_009352 [Eciton burchellii]|nr:hypothetical protein HN011_009352 [Eciton burchellii]